MVADEGRMTQGRGDVMPEACRPFGLGGDLRAGATGVRKAGIGRAEGKLANQAGFAGGGIGIDHGIGVALVTVERDDVETARRHIDDGSRRWVRKPAAKQKMVGIGGFDRRAR